MSKETFKEFRIEDYLQSEEEIDDYLKVLFDDNDLISCDDFYNRLVLSGKANPGSESMKENGAWLANTFYPGEVSMKTLRLRSGLLPCHAAELFGLPLEEYLKYENGVSPSE